MIMRKEELDGGPLEVTSTNVVAGWKQVLLAQSKTRRDGPFIGCLFELHPSPFQPARFVTFHPPLALMDIQKSIH